MASPPQASDPSQPAAANPAGPAISPQRAAADARAATLGRVVALLMASPRHASLTVGDLAAFVTPPISLGQLALMGGPTASAAAVWWAYVSPDVDKRLSASTSGHLKLEIGDWKSGDQPWIIEMVGDQKLTNELIKQIAQKHFQGRPVKLRGTLPDGRMAVGRLESRPPESKATTKA